MSKARITYRFDRNMQRTLTAGDHSGWEQGDERLPSKVIPLHQEDSDRSNHDYGAWKSPFDAETERIERLIREPEHYDGLHDRDSIGSSPLYYTSPQADESFARVPFYEEPIASAYRRKRTNTNWFGMTSSVAGAVLTGVILGMFVLSMFRGDPVPDQDITIDPANSGLPAAVGETNGNSATFDTDSSGISTIPNKQAVVELPEQTYFLVQNGVFSSAEGAEQAIIALKDKGLSGTVDGADKFSVFAGAASDRDDALLISHHLQNESLEVYIKPFVLPAVNRISWAGEKGEQLQGYLQQSRELANRILGMSSSSLNGIVPAALTPADVQTMMQAHKQWTESANIVLADAAGSSKIILQQMNTSLNSAILTLEQYDKNPSAVYLWQAQAAVSEHIIAQKAFLDTFADMY